MESEVNIMQKGTFNLKFTIFRRCLIFLGLGELSWALIIAHKLKIMALQYITAIIGKEIKHVALKHFGLNSSTFQFL